MPSMSPTHNETQSESVQFTQDFTLQGSKFFNETEIRLFELLMENYTTEFDIESVVRVNTSCAWMDQTASVPPLLIDPFNRRLGYSLSSNCGQLRSLQQEQQNWLVSVQYRMTYDSNTVNVSSYPSNFARFVNSDLGRVTNDLSNLGIPVIKSDMVSELFSQTPYPTTSPFPSYSPTATPTSSASPSPRPSARDTLLPTLPYLSSANPSQFPTAMPTQVPTLSPTAVNQEENAIIIVSVVVVVASLVMIALYVFYRRRKKQQELGFQTPALVSGGLKRGDSLHQGPLEGSWNAAVGKSLPQKPILPVGPRTYYSPDGNVPSGAEGLISPSESLVSNQSLLSTGNSMAGDSGDEADTTQNLQDEFDQYKDQNLEKMRAEVEGSLSDFDGMMSQALTKALMDDDEMHVDPGELYWGGVRQQRGAEIEASALCEVLDWLKRNDAANLDRK